AGAPARVVVDPPSPYFTVAGRGGAAANGPAPPPPDTKEEGAHTRTHAAGGGERRAEPRTFPRPGAPPAPPPRPTPQAPPSRRGIAVGGAVRIGVAPADGLRVLAAHDSAPLAVVAQDLNKRSNNLAAEQVIRTIGAEIGGRPGNWDKGLKAVGRYLGGIGVKPGRYQVENGTG